MAAAGKWWEMGDLLWEIGQNLVDFFWHFFTRGKKPFMIEFQGAKKFRCACFWGGVAGYKVGKFQ